MKKGIIIMICGLPGSGKTTLAKKLEKERYAVLLNADEWIINTIKSKSEVAEIDRLRDPMEKILWNFAQKLALIGTNSIIDNGFWTKSERKTYLDTAKKSGIKIELHFLDISKEELLDRVVKRNNNLPKNDFEMDMNKMKRWFEVFEPPTEQELITFDFHKRYSQ